MLRHYDALMSKELSALRNFGSYSILELYHHALFVGSPESTSGYSLSNLEYRATFAEQTYQQTLRVLKLI